MESCKKMVERKKIIATTDTCFHLLRHFSEISETEMTQFLNASFTTDQILSQLKISGSKFYPAFSEGPFNLITKLTTSKEKYNFLQDSNTFIFIWEFSELENAEPIGFDGLVNLNDLDAKEMELVYLANRGEHKIFHYTTNKVKNTRQLVMSCIETVDSFLVKTCFPGTYAPPFPAENYSPELNLKASQFWSEHALIIYQTNAYVK